MRRKNLPKFFRLRWYEYSLSYQVYRRVSEMLNPREGPELDLRQALRGNDWKVAWLEEPEKTPWFREGLAQSARAVQGMQGLAAQQGFHLILVVYPYPKMMAENKLQNEYVDFWNRFGRENNIPVIDLSPLFVLESQAVDQTYRENFIPGDFHWNARGSARVAEFLLPSIAKHMPARKGLAEREIRK